MGNSHLESRAALDGFSLQREGLSLTEIVDASVFSLACNASEQSAVNGCLQSSFAVDWPSVGRCTVSNDSTVRVLGLQKDQVFIVLNDASGFESFRASVATLGWCMEQSDSWVSMRVSGERRFDVLERTCPIDLHPSVFTEEHVARTSMEHMGSIIYCVDEAFVLMAPRSMAKSFVHALEESVEFVL